MLGCSPETSEEESMNDAERWVELETRLAFQERAVAELQQAALAQQRRLDRLQAWCEGLRTRLAPPPGEDAEGPPPHYGTKAKG
jgi:uncharacterized coiled-coil protein SlyX